MQLVVFAALKCNQGCQTPQLPSWERERSVTVALLQMLLCLSLLTCSIFGAYLKTSSCVALTFCCDVALFPPCIV